MPVSIIRLAIWTPTAKAEDVPLTKQTSTSLSNCGRVNLCDRQPEDPQGVAIPRHPIHDAAHQSRVQARRVPPPCGRAKARQQAESDAVTEFLKQEQTVQVRTGKVNNGREQGHGDLLRWRGAGEGSDPGILREEAVRQLYLEGPRRRIPKQARPRPSLPWHREREEALGWPVRRLMAHRHGETPRKAKHIRQGPSHSLDIPRRE